MLQLQASALFLLVVTLLTFACVSVLTQYLSPLADDRDMQYAHGILVKVATNRDFVLLTATGKQLSFRCPRGCVASLAHMQRHVREHAPTDVYFTRVTHNELVAQYVD